MKESALMRDASTQEKEALQWAIGHFQSLADFLKHGGTLKEDLKNQIRMIRSGVVPFDYSDDVAQLVKDADGGDEAAHTILLETAATFIEQGIALEYDSPLREFLVKFLRNPKLKRKPGRKHRVVAQRNTLIGYAVWRINRDWKFPATRNEATQSASAISITKKALSEVGINLTEAAITKIWNAINKETARWKKELGIK
jgi:hypothetical protein